ARRHPLGPGPSPRRPGPAGPRRPRDRHARRAGQRPRAVAVRPPDRRGGGRGSARPHQADGAAGEGRVRGRRPRRPPHRTPPEGGGEPGRGCGTIRRTTALRRRTDRVTYDDILYDRDETGIVTITINRPEKLNAFSAHTVDELIHAFSAAWKDRGCGVVILTGAGERAFCVGGDQSARAGGGG